MVNGWLAAVLTKRCGFGRLGAVDACINSKGIAIASILCAFVGRSTQSQQPSGINALGIACWRAAA
jgi:hypothetical protein